MRTIIVAIVALLMPFAASAQAPQYDLPKAALPDPAPAWKKPSGIPPAGMMQNDPLTKEAPLKSELETIYNSLSKQLQDVERYTAYLKGTASKTPEDTQSKINDMANILGNLADRLQANGDLTTQLNALRNSAAVHRKRVQEMAKEAIEESDRTTLMSTWDKALADTDKTGAMLTNMREKVNSVLKKLRMRQAAVSEFLLAGEFQAALASLKAWITELDATVNSLRAAIEPNKPAS